MELNLAAVKITDITYNSVSSYGLTSGKVNYLGKFSYRSRNSNSISINTQFSSNGRLLKGDLKGNHSHKRFDLGVGYEIIDKSMDLRLPEDLETINLTPTYYLMEVFNSNRVVVTT